MTAPKDNSGMPREIYTVTCPGSKSGIWSSKLLYKGGGSTTYILSDNMATAVEVEDALILMNQYSVTADLERFYPKEYKTIKRILEALK